MPSGRSHRISSSRARCCGTRSTGERTGRDRPAAGDELARALGIEPGPQLGRLLAELTEASYAGEIDGDQAVLEHARAWLTRDTPAPAHGRNRAR